MLVFGLAAGLGGLFIDQFGAALRSALSDSLARERALIASESALRDERERLQVTLGSIGDAVIATDASGRITFMNPVAEDLTGWTSLDAQGRPLAEVFHIVNETTRQPVENPVARVIREGLIVGLANHTVLIARGGREVPIDDSGAPIRSADGEIVGVILVFRDIAGRKLREHYDTMLLEMTSALSEAATPQAVAQVIMDRATPLLGAAQGGVMQRDHANTHLDFLNPEGVPGDVLARYPRIPLDLPAPASDAIRTGKPIFVESVDQYLEQYPALADILRGVTGSRSVAAVPLRDRTETSGVISFSYQQDHSFGDDERAFLLALAREVALALTRADLYEAERAARQHAEDANDLKLKFLAMISHELRTPLASIKGFTSTLLADDVTWDADSQGEFLEIINQETDSLTSLVEQLLDLSRLEAGTLAIQRKPHFLTDVIAAARPRLDIICAQHNIEIDLPADLPLIQMDAPRISQVITNLIQNACKYSPPGSAIRLSASHNSEMVQLSVSDVGLGIPPEEREAVFEPFRQAGNRPINETKGAGLGLAVAKAMVAAHGGRIWIEDHDGPGITITFTLPINPP